MEEEEGFVVVLWRLLNGYDGDGDEAINRIGLPSSSSPSVVSRVFVVEEGIAWV